MAHFAFPGNIDFAADDQGVFLCIIHERMLCWFIVCEAMFTMNHEHFPIQMTQNCKHSKQLQILAEQDFPLKLLWRLRRWKFIGARIEEDNCEAERTSLSSTAKATSSTQRPQTCTEAATKYYNYTVNETDEEREHRLPTLPNASRMDQATLIKFTVKITFFDAAIGSKSCAPQSYFSNGLGTADQPLHHEQQSVLQ